MKAGTNRFLDRLKRLKEKLKKSGIKLTHQRLEIFREVMMSENHPDAETIFHSVRKRIPSISPDTVYRTLWLLMDMGMISTLGPLRERTRFDPNTDHHHHFICTKCGMACDFYYDEFDRLNIPESIEAIGKVENTQVEFRGICLKCLKRKE